MQFSRLFCWLFSCGAGCAWAAETTPSLLDLSVEELLEVEMISAPRFSANPDDIPSAVTVITRDQILTFGWQTLADILQAQPGFTVTNDYTYAYAAIRGLSVSGDYRARSQVLVNGNRINENIYDSVGIDTSFPLDLTTIEHIELIQGPSASVYGGNSMFGVINIVTRSGQGLDGTLLRGNVSSGRRQQLGITHGRHSAATDVLFNLQAFDGNGRSLTYPELTAAGVPDTTRSVDAERGYKFMARLNHRDWRFSMYASDREKGVPTGSYGTIVGDLGHIERDRSMLAELGYRRALSPDSNWDARLYYGGYRYDGYFPYDYDPDYVINVDDADGKWWGMETTVALRIGERQQLTMGVEFRDNIEQRQFNLDIGMGCVDAESPLPCMVADYDSRIASLYLQHETKLTSSTSLSLGYRLDKASDFANQHNPRLGLVQRLGRLGTLKYLYAQAYRLPNPYERFYSLPAAPLANPALKPEDMRSHEVTWELPLGADLQLTTSLYRYTLDRFVGTDVDGVHYNLPEFSASGLETTATGSLGVYRFSISYTQQAPEGESIVEELIPQHMLKLNLGIPLGARGWNAGVEGRMVSHRHTSFSAGRIGGYGIANLTLTYLPPRQHWQMQMGIKDVFDRSYEDPVAADPAMTVPRDRMPQLGRSWFIDFGWQW